MKQKKRAVTFKIDGDLWDMAKDILPCSRGQFIEKKILEYVNSSDEEAELKKELVNLESTIQNKKDKLKQIQDRKNKNTENQQIIQKAMITVYKINLEHKCVPMERINSIANLHNINKEFLKEKIIAENIKIVK